MNLCDIAFLTRERGEETEEGNSCLLQEKLQLLKAIKVFDVFDCVSSINGCARVSKDECVFVSIEKRSFFALLATAAAVATSVTKQQQVNVLKFTVAC